MRDVLGTCAVYDCPDAGTELIVRSGIPVAFTCLYHAEKVLGPGWGFRLDLNHLPTIYPPDL